MITKEYVQGLLEKAEEVKPLLEIRHKNKEDWKVQNKLASLLGYINALKYVVDKLPSQNE